MTPLDMAIAAAANAPEEDAAHRAVLAALAGSELYLLLTETPQGDGISPRLFELETGPIALVFDREERLADFAGPAPYAAMTGRDLVGVLQGKGLGLGVNLGAGEGAETILPTDALDWLYSIGSAAEIGSEAPIEIGPPEGLDEALLPQIEARLAAASGLAARAILVRAEYADGRVLPCLFVLDAVGDAQDDIARHIGDVVAIMGGEDTQLDLAFVEGASEMARRALAVGLAIDLPAPDMPPEGPDPSKPPRLR